MDEWEMSDGFAPHALLKLLIDCPSGLQNDMFNLLASLISMRHEDLDPPTLLRKCAKSWEENCTRSWPEYKEYLLLNIMIVAE